jgi:hypothetical protein
VSFLLQHLFEAFTIVDLYVLLYHAFCLIYKVLKTLLSLVPIAISSNPSGTNLDMYLNIDKLLQIKFVKKFAESK